MSFVVGTRMRVGNPAAAIEATATAREQAEAAGALQFNGLQWLTGEPFGAWTVVSRWDSLDTGFDALATMYADPEMQSVMAEAGVEPIGRIVGVLERSHGETAAAHVGVTTFSIGAPDPGRLEAVTAEGFEVGKAEGMKGLQLIRMLAAGPGTGMWVAAAQVDTIDAYPASAAAAAPLMAEHLAPMQATIVDRQIFKVH